MSNNDNAKQYVHSMLNATLEKKGSDLFITANASPSIKLDGRITPLSDQPLTEDQVRVLVRSIMNDRHLKSFEEEMECNFSIHLPGKARFRVNAFTQQGCSGMVLRFIPNEIPDFKSLHLPPIIKDLSMAPRGLLILVGGTGSGKSTTIAAMIDHRNETAQHHIVTIEDPIEFVHEHKKSIITQREVGIDTYDFDIALKNTLRQAPDVILIGEVRDRETMEYAITYAETGHLCLATLHANSANQAIDRIINFFPEERRQQLLMDLSSNLRAIVSQRLAKRSDKKGRVPAIEVLINTPLMSDLIYKGDINAIKELISKSNEAGMCTFDQTLFRLIESDVINVQEAMRHADSVNDLRLQLKLNGKRSKKFDLFKGTENLSIQDLNTPVEEM